MKIVKKIAIILSVLLFTLFLAAVLVPILFKGRLVEMARQQINENINATVTFADVGVSFLRSFPDINLCVEDFSVTGIDRFSGLPLISGDRLDLRLQFWSVVRSNTPVQIKSVDLQAPKVNVLVLRDGSANYDIAKDTGEETSQETGDSNLEISLDNYRITDGSLSYEDRSMDTYLRAAHLNHAGSGNFTLNIFDLDTETTIDSLTVRQGGITYLSDAKVFLDAIFNIDNGSSKYTLKDNMLTVNEFRLQADGFVQLAGEDVNLDLSLRAPSNDFKDLWSLIPNAYIQDYASVQAEGQFRFDGRINGTYNGDREQYPAFDINLEVDNGRVKYPDLPLSITNINGRGNVKSPSSDFDELVVDVPVFSVRIGDSPFQARFRLTTPVSDPDLDAAVKGVIDLAALRQAYPMEGMEELSGIIRADIEARTKLSYLENKAYERVLMKGAMGIEKLGYQAAPYPPIFINAAEMTFTPAAISLSRFDGKFGESDLKATGNINNFLAYFSPEKTMTGDLSLRSAFFDLNEWYSEEESSAEPAAIPASTEEEELFTRFEFAVDAEAGELIYDSYRLLNTRARGLAAPNRIELNEGSTRLGDSDLALRGTITNAYDYAFEDGILGGRLSLRSDFLNLNQFMESEGDENGQEEALEPILVPDNIAMTIDADIDRLRYTNLDLRKVQGTLIVEDQAVVLDDVRASTLGGTVRFSGGYETRDSENPAFNFKYDMASMDFQQAFNALNTFQAIAPIGKFINGDFNTSLIMSGTLGANMMPRLSSLNAEGFLETLNGVIRNFKPLQAVGQQLNVQYLTDDWQIVNTKNWFEVKDGFVEVKDFDTRIKDIPMVIGGRHGLNQEMDYHIRAIIPRKLLEKSAVGQAANTGLKLLTEQASRLGVNIGQGENINVQVNLSGSIAQPKVGIKFLGMDGEASLAEAAKSQLESEAQKKLEEGKERAEEAVNEVLDSARTIVDEQTRRLQEEAQRKADTLLKQAGQEAAKKLGDEAKKTVEQVLDSTAVKGVDDIKKELEKWNPFKKKPAAKDTTKNKNNG